MVIYVIPISVIAIIALILILLTVLNCFVSIKHLYKESVKCYLIIVNIITTIGSSVFAHYVIKEIRSCFSVIVEETSPGDWVEGTLTMFFLGPIVLFAFMLANVLIFKTYDTDF